MTLAIDHLFEHGEHSALVASWIYEAFWRERDDPRFTPAKLEGYLREAGDPDAIPLSRLALVDGVPAGTVNLVEDDDSKRPHLRPWLAALVVAPEFRNRGVGSALVRALKADAVRLGLTELYLGTPIPEFYERLGATVIERDGDHYVMRIGFSADA